MSTTLQITVDPDLAEWLAAEAKVRGYGSIDEFALDLLDEGRARSSGDWMEPMIQEAMLQAPPLGREEIKRRITEHTVKLVDEAIASGPPIPVTPEFWEGIRREARERAAKLKGQ